MKKRHRLDQVITNLTKNYNLNDNAIAVICPHEAALISYLYVTKSYASMFNSTPEQIVNNPNNIASRIDMEMFLYFINNTCIQLQKYKKLFPHLEYGVLQYTRIDDTKGWMKYTIIDKGMLVTGNCFFAICVEDVTQHQEAYKKSDESEIFKLAESRMQDNIIIVNTASGMIMNVTESFLRATGYNRNELIGNPVTLIDPNVPIETFIKIASNETSRVESMHRRKDGSFYDVEICSMRTEYMGESVTFCVNRDITERKTLEKQLARERYILGKLSSFLQELIDSNLKSDKMMQSIVRNAMEWGNGAAAAIFLREDDKLVCKASEGSKHILSGHVFNIHTSLPGRSLLTNTVACCQDEPCKGLEKTRCSDCLGYSSMLAIPLCYDKEPIGVICVVATTPRHFGNLDMARIKSVASVIAAALYQAELFRQNKLLLKQKSDAVKQLEQANNTLANLATVDSLTGLKNRRVFTEFLENEIAQCCRYETNLSLLMIDIDHFKKFNDDFGHQCGDYVLKKVAAILEANIRSADLAARYGGEEFVIVLPNTDMYGAYSAAEHCRRAIECSDWEDKRPVTASFGVASFNKRNCTVEGIVAAADKALYRAKETGRNCVVSEECMFKHAY